MGLRTGGHATIREIWLQQVKAIYPDARGGLEYMVELVDTTPSLGRDRVYLTDPRDGARLCVWKCQVAGAPFCGYCEAGWHNAGRRPCCRHMRPRSADGRKTLLHKPFELVGRLAEGEG